MFCDYMISIPNLFLTLVVVACLLINVIMAVLSSVFLCSCLLLWVFPGLTIVQLIRSDFLFFSFSKHGYLFISKVLRGLIHIFSKK